MTHFPDLITTLEGLAPTLQLTPVPLAPELALARGAYRGAPCQLETRVLQGGTLRHARAARFRGERLFIGNLLLLSRPDLPLPMLGADLVWLGGPEVMLAVDLTPTHPEAEIREAVLESLLSERHHLPSGGDLPVWAQRWFSPAALYTRLPLARAPEAAHALEQFTRSFVALAASASPRPELAGQVLARQHEYCADHRREDRGLALLGKVFGEEFCSRYLKVLFPE